MQKTSVQSLVPQKRKIKGGGKQEKGGEWKGGKGQEGDRKEGKKKQRNKKREGTGGGKEGNTISKYFKYDHLPELP